MSLGIALTVLLLELAWWFYKYQQRNKSSDTSPSASHIPSPTQWRDAPKPIESTVLKDLASHRLDLLLKSPYALSPIDKAYVDPILSAADTQSANTRRKITQHQNELEHLRTTLTLLDTKRHQIRSLNAPIRRIPPEILSNIFSLCVGTINLDDTSLPVTLRTISRVSKHWRRISQSTPQIWSALSLFWDSDSLSSPAVARRLRYALQRSGDIPISLSFYV
ncbi:hypothetical protein VNI00_008824 [Paramarasmius palmivorus]|uniref:F-box domain-containing protein n=1 Tax=Paramarasmius palmivorus TaxID=297713 RepID=A0AAW0CS18_9AGAR